MLSGLLVDGLISHNWEQKFHDIFVPRSEISIIWNFPSRERKLLEAQVPAFPGCVYLSVYLSVCLSVHMWMFLYDVTTADPGMGGPGGPPPMDQT